MNDEYILPNAILLELDDLMQIATVIEKSSRPLPNTEISK